ncbi:hypothetical protein BYT27DRAFT_7259964 [Phlegmacium glaucopus]|nr:hypothetical protein BYT27DRAFT_7259964 [Phlegmacium glaucopus]
MCNKGKISISCHINGSFIPVRLTGGGDGCKLFGPDTEIVDVFSAEEITTTRQLFNPDEWIAMGKTWSATLPLHVRLAFADVQNVPVWMLDLIPQPQVSVSDLHATTLPSSTSASTTLLLSAFAPTVFGNPTSKDNLLDHPIFFGGKAVLAAFEKVGLEQAWLSGCKSICFDQHPDRYPLWTQNFVQELQVYRADTARWEATRKWLEAAALLQSDSTPIETPDIVNECHTRLSVVPWRGEIMGFGKDVQFTARHLALFLSNEWLDDEMINAGSDWILPAEVSYVPRTRLDHLISTHNVDVIFLPLHVFGNHWTLLQVNLSDATYSYADCLHHGISPPPSILNLVQWWLTSLAPHIPHLQPSPFNFDLPRQRDGFSCGIIVLDLMATILLQYSIWNPQSAAVRRMEWFLRLSADFNVLSESSDTESDSSSASTQISTDNAPSLFPSSNSSTPSFSDEISGHKRPHSLVSEDLFDRISGEESDSHEGCLLARRRGCGSVKPGSSWALQKSLRNDVKRSKDFPTNRRLNNFRQKIYNEDPHAEFRDNNLLLIRCSACTEWLTMRVPYDVRRWKEHRATKKCLKNRSTGLVTCSLLSLGFVKSASVPKPNVSGTIPSPCPGLLRNTDPRIDRYMSRTSSTGGGAPSRHTIAKDLFKYKDGVLWKDLSARQQKMVLRREELSQLWKISRSTSSIFSSACEVTVHGSASAPLRPCSECDGLYKVHKFLVAINRPMPSEEDMKYVPKAYRNPELGTIYLKYKGVRELVEKDDGCSPWLKFAQGVLDGLYKSDTLLGMVEAFVIKADRIRKGKSLCNMKYTNTFNNFCNLLASTSTRAYETFRRHFGGRTMHSIRKLRAKMPRFQPGLSADNHITLAAALIKKYEYYGPLALSWDDTELEPAISVFQKSKDVCIVIGSVDGELLVQSYDDIDCVLQKAQLDKAEKLRIWLLTIPLPKIPPILIAAVARGSSEDAEGLHLMHIKLADLLHQQNIHPVSLASDGTEVERRTQSLITDSASGYVKYIIPTKSLGPSGNTLLHIGLYRGLYPFVAVQDSKHALKTARNQLLTGARILIMGFFAAFFAQLRELAINATGPLFTRDIEKLDRQDDRAAARTFSASALNFQMKEYHDQRGLSVYLFVLGELVDAWQNRNISHVTRAKMVLRARFFLMAWRSYIVSHPDYSTNIQFISRESFDIFMTLSESLLSLILIYRKYYPRYPFLPWLHSTEPCEHVFGVMRQIKKDFTFADMLNAQPKLQAFLLGAFGDLSAEEQANQTAAGYHHTYFKADDLDLKELLRYPSDDDLANASDAAFREAEQLLLSLGINAKQMLGCYIAPEKRQRDPKSASRQGPQTLAQALALYQAPSLTAKEENRVEAYEMALVADSIDRSLAFDELADSTEITTKKVKATIQSQLTHSDPEPSLDLPLPLLPPTPWSASPLSFITAEHQLNREILVAERRRHETSFMAKAVRQRGHTATTLTFNDRTFRRFVEEGPTLRESLLLQLSSLGVAVTTSTSTAGVNRQVRHNGTFTEASSGTTQAKNKATVRMAAATKFLHLRDQAFSNFRGIHDNFHIANVTSFNTLNPGNLIIALRTTKEEVILGEVITMYSKSEGKGSKHEWIPSAPSIGVLSYVYIRTFNVFTGNGMFSSLTCPSLSSSTILQIPRTHILFSLASSASNITSQELKTADGHPFSLITLDTYSVSVFDAFRLRSNDLYKAVKVLQKGVRSGTVGDLYQAATKDTVVEALESDSEDEENLL